MQQDPAAPDPAAHAPAKRKRALRREATRARNAAAKGADADTAAAALRDRALTVLDAAPGDIVAGFWPMGTEIDVRPLLTALHEAGAACCLPVVVTRDAPLVFRRWAPGDSLEPAGFGTSVPGEDASVATPGKLIVPLLAFDRRGYRLGYGGGYYDRTLAALRLTGPALAIGVAFAAQELAAVPHDRHDVPLDWVVTEREAIYTGGDRPEDT